MKPTEVTDEWLYQVMPLVDHALLAELESGVDYEYEFSEGFEKKMKRLIRRAAHPIWHRILRVAAAFVLVLSLGGAGVLAFSSEARAMVSRWISYQGFGSQYYDFFDDREPPETVPRYHIGWIPDGFFLQADDYGGNWGDVTYANSEETEFISLNYSLMGSTTFSYFDDQGVTEESLTINGMDAKSFDWIGQDWHYLVWLDEEQGLVFMLGADLAREDCIRVAESVYAEN